MKHRCCWDWTLISRGSTLPCCFSWYFLSPSWPALADHLSWPHWKLEQSRKLQLSGWSTRGGSFFLPAWGWKWSLVQDFSWDRWVCRQNHGHFSTGCLCFDLKPVWRSYGCCSLWVYLFLICRKHFLHRLRHWNWGHKSYYLWDHFCWLNILVTWNQRRHYHSSSKS